MSGHAFVVHAARLRRSTGTRWDVERAGPVADLAVGDTVVPEGADASATVTLESVAGGVSVVGVVDAPWAGECRRCLRPTSGQVHVAVRELYTPGGDGEDTYPLRDDEIDLEPLVRDAVLLELPVTSLCRPDCRGLCPACGADWNEGPCGCEAPADPRWAALDVLRGEPGAED
ncbi:MAG TPA: DUF177 domain-containing protein [Acidimicrobiales bacterium]|nr:DUF177 domain-containing protein [Acidimicrobiales bacterium]